MAAIVRVKRRRDDDAAESLLLLCKKAKSDSPQYEALLLNDDIKSVFKYAGTVEAKEGTVATQCVSQAIRKEKLQKEYKSLGKPVESGARTKSHQSHASQLRYKIVAQRRALDFASLASDADASNSVQVTVGSGLGASSDSHAKQALKSRMFCLYDVEKVDSKIKGQAGVSAITCNDVPMIRETLVLPGRVLSLAVPEDISKSEVDDGFVYDVYYMNDSKFDFRALENVLAVESYREEQELVYDCASDDEDMACYDDEDDENAEGNWRNDYPDSDPMYFERFTLEENYSSGDDSVDRFYKDDEDGEERY